MTKYFIASDLHGEYNAFIFGLLEAGFDINNPNHKIILAGDLFDRGHFNDQIYDFVQKNKGKIYFIKGNHDQMLLDFLKEEDDGRFNCEYNGMFETLINLSGLSRDEVSITDLRKLRFTILNKRPEIIGFLKSMVDGYKIDNYIITHAGFTKNLFNNKFHADNWANTPKFIRAIRDSKNYEHYIFVFGHWHAFRLTGEFLMKKDDESNIFRYRNFIGLDACSNYTKRVNILVVETDTEPQPFGGSINLDMLETF